MADKGYSGWANWATWNVALWFDGDYGLYRYKIAFLRRTVTLTASAVQDFVTGLLVTGTPDMEGASDYEKVDWEEITEAWESDQEELYN